MALVNYLGKNVFGVCGSTGEIIRLLPGINEIDDNKFSEFKTLPLFQSRINKGLIVILNENLDKDGKRKVEEMLEHMTKIFDVRLLKKIIANDGRETVVNAAKKQIDFIKNPSKEKSEEMDDHFK